MPIAPPTTSPGCATRTRRSTRSTASSRSTWTRAAPRARGRRSSTTSTTRRRGRSRRWRRNAQWFEDRMPWEPRFRKPQVTGVTAKAIEVVIETGDSGPITPIGINLPNDQAIREQYGSKSVSLSNVSEAYELSTPEGLRVEFSWSAEEAERAPRVGRVRVGADDRDARGHRPRLRPHGRGRHRARRTCCSRSSISAIEEVARRPGGAVLPARPQARRAGPGAGRAITRRSSAPSTSTSRATR